MSDLKCICWKDHLIIALDILATLS